MPKKTEHEIEDFKKKIFDQKQLIQISKALNSDLNLRSLIELILDICLARSQSLQIGIFLYPRVNSKNMRLHRHIIGFDVSSFDHFMISSKSSFFTYLLNVKHGLLLSDLRDVYHEQSEDFNEIIEMLSKLNEELLLIPLRNRGVVNGIIILGTKTTEEDYTPQEKEFLGDVASIAAIAVANARLYELATVDMMTQLKMHHFFQMKLRENIQKKHEGFQNSFSLIITDIDHFKKFNDTYGHQLGDLVLAAVAEVVIKNARAIDITCRYGGEEFAVILPNTKLAEAIAYAERIRHAVEDLKLNSIAGIKEEKLKITISIGVAEYNMKKDLKPKLLIGRCDKALYRAKDAGRNQVIKAL